MPNTNLRRTGVRAASVFPSDAALIGRRHFALTPSSASEPRVSLAPLPPSGGERPGEGWAWKILNAPLCSRAQSSGRLTLTPTLSLKGRGGSGGGKNSFAGFSQPVRRLDRFKQPLNQFHPVVHFARLRHLVHLHVQPSELSSGVRLRRTPTIRGPAGNPCPLVVLAQRAPHAVTATTSSKLNPPSAASNPPGPGTCRPCRRSSPRTPGRP